MLINTNQKAKYKYNMLESQEVFSYFKFLQDLCGNRYSKIELDNFIERLAKIAESYIRYNYSRIKRLVNPSQNSFKSIALEAITPLFLESHYNNQFIIVDLIKNWNPPIKSEEESLFFLNKIISNRIEQHISLKLRESDPLFSKLLNSINYLIRSGGYRKVNYLGKAYITEGSKTKIDWVVIDDNEFQKIPSYLVYEKKVLLQALFEYIKTETNYFPAIPLNELIFKLKHINQSDFAYKNSHDDLVEQIEIDETVNTGLKYTEGKLKSTYYDKNKIDQAEYKNFKKALNILATDLRNGGVSSNLYTYLYPHFDDLTKETYQENYHNIFEYLVKLFKNKVTEELLLNKETSMTILSVITLDLIALENEILEIISYFC